MLKNTNAHELYIVEVNDGYMVFQMIMKAMG